MNLGVLPLACRQRPLLPATKAEHKIAEAETGAAYLEAKRRREEIRRAQGASMWPTAWGLFLDQI